MNKITLLNIVDETKNIVDKHHLITPELNTRFDAQHHAVENFTAKILFVGQYSAGKSALINAFLGDYVLEENISPETAVATEVKAPEFPDLVLVDMPGFDSGIEAHNKALVNYIGEAAAYVFVIDAEKGTVSQSSLRFLNEIKNYSRFFRFVLTKTDKVTPANVDAIAKHVGETLDSELGEHTQLTITFNRDPAAHDKIKSLLEQFPTDQLMLYKLGDELLMLLNQSIDLLQVQLESLELNTADLDESIREREQQKIRLERDMNFQKRELHSKMQTENVSKILDDAEAALNSQIDSLIAAAEQGGDIFSERVNSILRPVLAQSAQENVELSVGEFIDALGNVNRNDPNAMNDKIDNARRTANLLQTALERSANFAQSQEFNRMFKVLSTVTAVLTNVIAPWMELVIIFMPEIIGVLNGLLGNSREDQIREKLTLEIIPQLRERLRPVVQQSMREVEEQMVADINKQFRESIDNEINALDKLREEKSQRELDGAARKATLEEDINRLRLRADEINAAMN